MLRPITSALGALILAGLAAAPPHAANADACFADWGAAGEVVRREKLLTVEQLATTSAAELSGSIVKSTLCREADGYVYQLVVRGGDGQLKSAVVPAKGR